MRDYILQYNNFGLISVDFKDIQ